MKGRRVPRTVEPSQRRSGLTRGRIFRAARKAFADSGMHGARVDEIARKARVNKQRIYAYFGSKEELYRQVLVEAYVGVAANERLMGLSEADVPRLTGLILDALFEIHETNPTFWKLLCWENLDGGTALRPEDWEQIRSQHVSHLRELYGAGQTAGVFRPDVDFNAYLMMLFSTTYFYFSNHLTMSRLLNVELDSPAVRETIRSQLARIMETGIVR